MEHNIQIELKIGLWGKSLNCTIQTVKLPLTLLDQDFGKFPKSPIIHLESSTPELLIIVDQMHLEEVFGCPFTRSTFAACGLDWVHQARPHYAHEVQKKLKPK